MESLVNSEDYTMDSLKGKVAIVTGGSSGIGLAAAELFAEESVEVIALSRSGKVNETGIDKANYPKLESIRFEKCDVTRKGDITSVKELVQKEYGRLDILFNNAGALITGGLEEISDEDWDYMYEVNVKAMLHMAQSFMPMLQASHGVILNNASINGLQSYIKGKKLYVCH